MIKVLKKPLIVNDQMTCIPNTKTLWHHLIEWLKAEWFGGDYQILATNAEMYLSSAVALHNVVIRNGTYFPWFPASGLPVISLIQDIHPPGHLRDWQRNVGLNSDAVVFNSEHTRDHYPELRSKGTIIPLGTDFDLFDIKDVEKTHDVVWVGAATAVKGWRLFNEIVRENQDLTFLCVTKDGARIDAPNVTNHANVPASEMVVLMNQAKIGLCTSEQETQHLAGVEMAACGLTVVAPPIGVYQTYPEWAFVCPPYHLSLSLRKIANRGWLSPNIARKYAISGGLSLDSCKQSWIELVNKVTKCNHTPR